MPEKQKTRSWKDPKTVLAAVCVTTLLTLWNALASHDRLVFGASDAHVSASLHSTSQTKSNQLCPTRLTATNLGQRCGTVAQTRSS